MTGALLVALLGGLSIWAVANQGSYGRSANGCVNVVLPSTTGGGIMHACGAAARTLCHRAVSEHTELGRLTRPQCRLAGLSR